MFFRVAIIISFLIIPVVGDDKDYTELHIPKDLSFLDLNSSQKSYIKKILKEYRKELFYLHQKEESWEKSLKSIFIEDSFKDYPFKEYTLKIKSKIVEVEAKFFKKMHAVLTKRQRAKFIEYIEEWEVE
jgi:Spy/CpxP family protein refolding chaperone